MALILASILFVIFAANVVIGATTGARFLDDLGEMLVLFAASIAFVAAILRREANTKKRNRE